MEPDGTPPDAPTNPVARPVVAAPPRPLPPPQPPPSQQPQPAWIPGDQPLPPELSPRKPGGPYAPGAPGGPGGSDKPPRKKRRFGWGKRIVALIMLLILVAAGLFWSMDASLHRTNALVSYPGRVANTAGTNWLIVGSDSRANLTPAERAKLATGYAAGGRTDTIMIVHTGGKKTSLLSLPRDSYVPIDGHGSNKLNAAFAFGGASLLVKTVEQITGLRIDHYAEIGFDGFATMVDAVGGVRLCLDAGDRRRQRRHQPAGRLPEAERCPGPWLRPQPQIRDR